MTTPVGVPDDPGVLDAWLARSEAGVPGIRPGTGKVIHWAGAPGHPTDLAVVYLHGFSASRHETAPLCDRVAAALGANLFYTRLTGHGRDSAAMAECSVEAWQADGLEALAIGRRIGRRVLLVGTSQGGTLATWVAMQQPAPLAGLVLIAPNFGPNSPIAFLLGWPGARRWVPKLVGPVRANTPRNPGHAAHWTTTYPTAALVPMYRQVRAVRRMDLARLAVPVLAVWSRQDGVVRSRDTERALDRIGVPTARRMPVEDSGDPEHHVIAGDVFSPGTTDRIAARIIEFAREVA